MRIASIVAFAAVLTGLLGCTTTPSARLTEHVAPVRSTWVVVYLGSFSAPISARAPGGAVSQAMETRLPEILRKNGVAVSGYKELARPLRELDELEQLWAAQRQLHGATSHVLVLTAQRVKTQNHASTIEYEAVLWDTTTRRLAWKGAPQSPLYARNPSVEAETLAGDALRALQRDAVIALSKGYPIGSDDKEIPRQWVPMLAQ